MPTMWKSSCDQTLPSLVPFHSLQVLLLLTTQWPIKALVKLLGRSPVEALQFHTTSQSHWSSGSIVCFLFRGVSALHPGAAQTHNWTAWVSPVSMSRYIIFIRWSHIRHSFFSVIYCIWKGIKEVICFSHMVHEPVNVLVIIRTFMATLLTDYTLRARRERSWSRWWSGWRLVARRWRIWCSRRCRRSQLQRR